MVEQQESPTYTEILYSPLGKTALMSGNTLTKAFVSLPGGATAIYNSTGLQYYRHPDWLGSSRLTSTATAPTTAYSSTAYGPFGELYDGFGTADPSFTGQNSDTTSSRYDFTFREQSPSQGRWLSPDPAGLAAVDPTSPQTWNRYAYVGNSPCSQVDPLGLTHCNLNVQFNNSAGLTSDQVTSIEQRIAQLFGATQSPGGDSVGINFTFTGQADSSLTVFSNASWFTKFVFNNPMGAEGGAWGAPTVYWSNTQAYNPYGTAVLAGSIGAHELAHALLGVGDLPYNASNPNMMMYDSASATAQGSANSDPNSPLWQFTPSQVATLLGKCAKAHFGHPGGGAGGAAVPTGVGGSGPTCITWWVWGTDGSGGHSVLVCYN
jgi:RHS repeat-associated protein